PGVGVADRVGRGDFRPILFRQLGNDLERIVASAEFSVGVSELGERDVAPVGQLDSLLNFSQAVLLIAGLEVKPSEYGVGIAERRIEVRGMSKLLDRFSDPAVRLQTNANVRVDDHRQRIEGESFSAFDESFRE